MIVIKINSTLKESYIIKSQDLKDSVIKKCDKYFEMSVLLRMDADYKLNNWPTTR